MSRECFKRGNMRPEYYTSVVDSVRKALTKYCDSNCDNCPFSTKPFCLLHTLESEFEEYAEDKRKIIKKRFVDLTELEVDNIITEPEEPKLDTQNPVELIENVRKFADYLENLEVELYEVEEK